jgi:trigger factor
MLAQQGIDPKEFLNSSGKTAEEYRETSRPDAEKRAAMRVILKNIANTDGIECTAEEFDAEISNIADSYKMKKEKVLKQLDSQTKLDIKQDIIGRKATEFVKESAVAE